MIIMPISQRRIGEIAVTHYEARSSSDRPPIVLVHGGKHAGWCWYRWAEYFSDEGWDCWVFDWLNHGESAQLPERIAVTRSIQDVARTEIPAIIDQLGYGQEPILIGHSMGGLAALTYAAYGDRRLSRLVLVSPVVPMQVNAEPIPVDLDFTKLLPPFPYEQAKQLFFTTMGEEQARSLYERLVPESPRAVREATWWTTWVDLDKVRVPTLLLYASEDLLVPPATTLKLAELLHAPVVEIPGVGHTDILVKDPDWRLAASKVRDWLASDTPWPIPHTTTLKAS